MQVLWKIFWSVKFQFPIRSLDHQLEEERRGTVELCQLKLRILGSWIIGHRIIGDTGTHTDINIQILIKIPN